MGKARASKPASGASSPRRPASAAWLLAGPEAGKRAEFIETLTAEITRRAGSAPERHRFHGFDARMAEVVMILSNRSLFAAHRLVTVSEAELVKRPEEVEQLVSWLGAPADDATLVLETDEVVAPKMRDPPVSAAILRMIPEDHRKVFWEMFDSDKRGWIVNYFRQRQISLGEGVVDHILDMVENNTRDLRAECDLLATFFAGKSAGPGASGTGPAAEPGASGTGPPAGTIDLERLEHYLYHGKGENVFTLFERLASRDFPAAEEVLAKILLSRGDEAEPTVLVAGLLWQFRRLAVLKRLVEVERFDPTEAFEKVRLLGKRNQQTHLAALRSYSRPEVDLVIELLVELDARLRSLKADLHPLLLQMAVYYISRRGGAGAWRLVG